MATLQDTFLSDLHDLSDYEADGEMTDEDIAEELADIHQLNYHNLDKLSKLKKSRRFNAIIGKIEEQDGLISRDDPDDYQFIVVDCTALLVDIENEIIQIHSYIRDNYRLKFPELESLIHHPIEYAAVVKKIGNEIDLTNANLKGLSPSDILVLQKTIEACDRAIALDSARKKVLDFVESRMVYIAPNLSVVVGSAVAAKLIGTAGGLESLANMSACNVQLLGAKRKNLAGFSSGTCPFHIGHLEQTEIFQSTPVGLKTRACRLLAAKSTLAARLDYRGEPIGMTGRSIREEICKKIEKWQEPPPARILKPLPLPDAAPKKKRGGRRLRKFLKVAKKSKEKRYGSSGTAMGLTSSLAFTPVQGIQLSNSQARARQLEGGTQSSYFSETGRFSKI